MTEEGEKYYWHEYLLFEPATKGFHWLIESDGHWSFATAISSAEVEDHQRNAAGKTIAYQKTKFRVFADGKAVVENVVGEFYWRVEVGETVHGIDYIAPPLGISKEIAGGKQSKEIDYTLAHYVTREAIEAAYNVKGLPHGQGVGMLQPYPGAPALAETLSGRTTYAMSGEVPAAKRIAYAKLQPGDVVFFGAKGPRSKPAEVDHAGVYAGEGWFVHSSSQGVTLTPLTGWYRQRFAWARRPLAEAGLGT